MKFLTGLITCLVAVAWFIYKVVRKPRCFKEFEGKFLCINTALSLARGIMMMVK